MSPLRNEYENNIRRAFSAFETGETEPADIKRWRDNVIVDLIPNGSKVLDFGCGRGDLLYRLIREKQVFGQGIERDLKNVYRCLERKIAVFQINFEKGLQFYGDGTFDYVILEDTIQTLNRPTAALREMLRIGTYGIITCPNFGHWRVRRFWRKKAVCRNPEPSLTNGTTPQISISALSTILSVGLKAAD